MTICQPRALSVIEGALGTAESWFVLGTYLMTYTGVNQTPPVVDLLSE